MRRGAPGSGWPWCSPHLGNCSVPPVGCPLAQARQAHIAPKQPTGGPAFLCGLSHVCLPVGLAWCCLAEQGGPRLFCPALVLTTCRHHLCHGRHYCHDLGDRVKALNGQVVWLVEQAGRQPDSTALYHFNASLYLLQVLKGGTAKGCMHEMQEELEAGTDPSPMTKGSQVSRAWPRQSPHTSHFPRTHPPPSEASPVSAPIPEALSWPQPSLSPGLGYQLPGLEPHDAHLLISTELLPDQAPQPPYMLGPTLPTWGPLSAPAPPMPHNPPFPTRCSVRACSPSWSSTSQAQGGPASR
ncbi:hypothetical protein P7K49_041003 [Saguinus oedipus]|uniref:Uncharacterized protein n=1 Tax=Saguinus oedipus TaxID=9490 RepID=A0ABQ9TA02_SAGOE|nr:hypothetical protein P7K49_041003 [Saguinus oedipus]